MYHRSSKRRQIVMRTLVYALMTVSVIAIVTVLMLIILGYSFNRQDGRLEQGGLLQYASTPSGATVTVDGVQVGSRTPSKSNVEAKSHYVQMDLKGYRQWQKTIKVDAGGIGWLSYARLIPTDVKTEQVRSFPKITASLATTSRKWIVAQDDAASNAFVLINIESDTPKFTSLTIPDSTLTKPETAEPQSFSLVSWSRNDDRLLVKRTYDTTKSEWIVVDRQNPDRSINVSTSLAIGIADMQFGERDGSNAYILGDDAIVRRADLGNANVTGPLAENIEEFSVYDNDTLVYVTKPDGKDTNLRHVGYRENGMTAAQTIFSYPTETQNIHVALGEYYGKNYIGVTHGTTLQVYVGSLPRGTTKTNLRQLEKATLPEAPTRLTIGDNGRMAVAEQPNGYTTFDIELSKTDTTKFNKPAAVAEKLQWLDAYVIANGRGGILRLYEFDGGNQQDIMPIAEGQAVSLSGNDKFVYGFSPNADGSVSFSKSRLTVDN